MNGAALPQELAYRVACLELPEVLRRLAVQKQHLDSGSAVELPQVQLHLQSGAVLTGALLGYTEGSGHIMLLSAGPVPQLLALRETVVLAVGVDWGKAALGIFAPELVDLPLTQAPSRLDLARRLQAAVGGTAKVLLNWQALPDDELSRAVLGRFVELLGQVILEGNADETGRQSLARIEVWCIEAAATETVRREHDQITIALTKEQGRLTLPTAVHLRSRLFAIL